MEDFYNYNLVLITDPIYTQNISFIDNRIYLFYQGMSTYSHREVVTANKID